MSNYVYTDNNNAISFGKLIQGQAGPQGSQGPNGIPGTTGPLGSIGPKGDDANKTEIAFNDRSRPYYRAFPYRGETLIGHLIYTDVQDISNVKVLVNGNTNNKQLKICLKVVDLMNYYYDSSANKKKIVVAEKNFQIKGRGKDQDWNIINLDLSSDITNWPPGDTVLGLFICFDPHKLQPTGVATAKDEGYIAQIARDYSPAYATLEKQSWELYKAGDEATIQETLLRQYEVSLGRRTSRELKLLERDFTLKEQKLNEQLRREKEIISRENAANARKKDYVSKDLSISEEYQNTKALRRAPIPKDEELQIVDKAGEETSYAAEDNENSVTEDAGPDSKFQQSFTTTESKFSRKVRELSARTKKLEEADKVKWNAGNPEIIGTWNVECSEWMYKYCVGTGTVESVDVAFLEIR